MVTDEVRCPALKHIRYELEQLLWLVHFCPQREEGESSREGGSLDARYCVRSPPDGAPTLPRRRARPPEAVGAGRPIPHTARGLIRLPRPRGAAGVRPGGKPGVHQPGAVLAGSYEMIGSGGINRLLEQGLVEPQAVNNGYVLPNYAPKG